MNFIITGTNYKYSPIELREKISFSKKRLSGTLSLLKERNVLKSAVILSTCNRVEVYAAAVDTEAGFREIEDFIFRYHEVEKKDFLPHLYRYTDKEAMRHLLMVAGGLDSLILGETQILEQVNLAFRKAQEANSLDNLLSGVFRTAISLAQKIHQQTLISKDEICVGSVAVDFIKERIGPLSNKNILIIGVGKVTELVLKYLKKEAPRVVFVSNRTFERAKDLASQIGAQAVRFEDLAEFLKDADVIITATASPHYVLKKETLENVVSKRLLIVDLAIPRDVDPGVKQIPQVALFNLEDLEPTIQKNLAERKIGAEKAEFMIKQRLDKIWQELIRLEPERVLLL